MSYEPTEWKAGDTITSTKLNKLEQGVANGGGILIVHFNMGTGTLDKTWQEIHDTDVCFIIGRDDESSVCDLVIETDYDDWGYHIFSYTGRFIADSPNGTLTFDETSSGGSESIPGDVIPKDSGPTNAT